MMVLRGVESKCAVEYAACDFQDGFVHCECVSPEQDEGGGHVNDCLDRDHAGGLVDLCPTLEWVVDLNVQSFASRGGALQMQQDCDGCVGVSQGVCELVGAEVAGA
jgi:hypothetical protein